MLGRVVNSYERKLTGKRTKQLWKNPEYKKRISTAVRNALIGKTGKLSHNWRGGLSFQKYPQEFNDLLKHYIKEKFNRKCALCKKNKKLLDVHHINYDKNDCKEENLILLCRSCHTKTNIKEKEKYIKILKKIVRRNKNGNFKGIFHAE
jgi:5-methylcytosine-specific restriction endonuclease McrA